jgi:predicted molibdopterin-dependent oxidoreductase YjgC
MSEGRLDRYGTTFDNWVTEENRIDCKPVWESLSECAERLGVDFSFNHAREIMAELSTKNPLFEGVTFERMDESRGIVLHKTAITA